MKNQENQNVKKKKKINKKKKEWRKQMKELHVEIKENNLDGEYDYRYDDPGEYANEGVVEGVWNSEDCCYVWKSYWVYDCAYC
ncbi:MAG: hypothetical protein EZS28_023662 [Streblomastix strix]|uniref:Uncharacterized protein n=1 Tax=Streblomastix strix TaxID=222440 RepID=A0A5J4VEE5_9EUKA|nr:MAG: hypothetical protein EZS28_023662 [Streblomastix strix]